MSRLPEAVKDLIFRWPAWVQGILFYSAMALYVIAFWLVLIGFGTWLWRGLAGFIEVAW